MAKTLLEFAAECASFGPRYKAEQKVTLLAAAQVTKDSIFDAARYRRWPIGKSGMGPVEVRSHVTGDSVEIRGRGGAIYAFEFGAAKHLILPREMTAGRRARRNSAAKGEKLSRVLKTPYGPRAFVEHPGFKGRPFWDRGIVIAGPKVVRVIEAGVVNTMRKVLT